jgi:hypothetical protein
MEYLIIVLVSLVVGICVGAYLHWRYGKSLGEAADRLKMANEILVNGKKEE